MFRIEKIQRFWESVKELCFKSISTAVSTEAEALLCLMLHLLIEARGLSRESQEDTAINNIAKSLHTTIAHGANRHLTLFTFVITASSNFAQTLAYEKKNCLKTVNCRIGTRFENIHVFHFYLSLLGVGTSRNIATITYFPIITEN